MVSRKIPNFEQYAFFYVILHQKNLTIFLTAAVPFTLIPFWQVEVGTVRK